MSLIRAALDKAEKNPSTETEPAKNLRKAFSVKKQEPASSQPSLISQIVKESVPPPFIKPHELRKMALASDRSKSNRSPILYILAGGLVLVVLMLIFFRPTARQTKMVSDPTVSERQSSLPSSTLTKSMVGMGGAPKLVLTGITSSGDDEYLALINNQIVAEGDMLKEKALVKKIQNRSVLLEFQGREITLLL